MTMPETTSADQLATDASQEPANSNSEYVVPRQRKRPYIPTQAEYDERVALCEDALAEGKSKFEIIRQIKEQFNVSTRTVESYLARARDNAIKATQKTREEWRVEQLSKYQAIADNPECADKDRLKALERIDKLFGLEQHAPNVMHVSGPDGAPIQSQQTIVQLDLTGKLAEYAGAIRAAALVNLIENQPAKQLTDDSTGK